MRIARVIRAFFYAASLFWKREPLTVLVVLLVLGILVWGALRPTETAEEAQARFESQRRQYAESKAAKENTKLLCTLKDTCEKYGTARQQCATAGSFQNCVRVKMGSINYEVVDRCTEDGKPSGIPASEIPDPLNCFLGPLFD
jgi:hypothetical protein